MSSGVVVALGVGLAWVRPLLLAVAAVGLLAVWALSWRAGYVVKDQKSVIALNAPLPGTMGPSSGLLT